MDEIVNLFTHEHGVFQQLFKFEVVIFFVVIMVIFSKLLGQDYVGVIILTAFGLYLTNLYVKVNNTNVNDRNKDIYLQLEALQNLTYAFIKYKINIVGTSNQQINETDKLNTIHLNFIC